ncbi:hypothetical protein ACOTDF_19300 [Achromobacter insuavis]|uniref:hypothetical protein n=1 Tax=Achromobacter insuavis TaxID=1287735 RepID=UPI003B9D18DE
MPSSFISPRFYQADSAGNPLVGGRLYTYINTTTTPLTTYQDAAGTIANTNPIILDSRGEAVIFLESGRVYTFVLKDSNDALVWSQDSISGAVSGSSGVAVVTVLPTSDVGPVYLTGGRGIFSWNGTKYVSDYSGGFGAGPYALKNKLANGDFRLWDNGTPVGPIVTASGERETANGWLVAAAGTSVSVTVSQVLTGSDYGMGHLPAAACRVTSNAAGTVAAGDRSYLKQNIKGYNIQEFGMGSLWGGSLALSFSAKASVAGTYCVALWNGGAPSDRSYVTTFDITTANMAEDKTVIIPVDQSGYSNWSQGNLVGMAVIFDLGSGTNSEGAKDTWLSTRTTRTSGSVRVVTTNAATLEVTRVQIQRGVEASPFESRPADIERFVLGDVYATETKDGLIRLASLAEARALANQGKAITPFTLGGTLNATTGSAPLYVARTWINYNGVSQTISASGNVSSVTYGGTGDYTVNVTVPINSSAAIVTGGTGTSDSITTNPTQGPAIVNQTASSFGLVTGSDTTAKANWIRVSAAVFL